MDISVYDWEELIGIIDLYKELVWTDRYWEVGEFELVVPATVGNYNILNKAKFLFIDAASQAMLVESVVFEVDVETGERLIRAQGESLESWTKHLSTHNYIASTSNTNERNYTKYTESLSPLDMISTRMTAAIQFHFIPVPARVRNILTRPGWMPGVPGASTTIIPEGRTNPWPDPVEWEVVPQNLYDLIYPIAQNYGIGIKFDVNRTERRLRFGPYLGRDRTSSQTLNPAVIFSPNLNNLSKTTEIRSIKDYKNVVHVFHPNQPFPVVVYAPGVSRTTTSIDQRSLSIFDESIDLPRGPDLSQALYDIGKKALEEHQSINLVDGELTMNSMYKYKTHYDVGDLVEVHSEDGMIREMIVTEHIWTSDESGDKSYPTLAAHMPLTLDSWRSWDPTVEWVDAVPTWQEV